MLVKLVNYIDSINDKVQFMIKLCFKYLDDNFDEKLCEFDMTIQQFYTLFNDFQNIDTMIKTLV